METVAYEMATHVSLTATTPILNQSNERNATLLDARGALAALSGGIPQFMLSSTLPVRFAIDFFGEGGLGEGDVGALRGLQKIKRLPERPSAGEATLLVAPMSPHRSALALLAWRCANATAL